jgi:hypothetical protein
MKRILVMLAVMALLLALLALPAFAAGGGAPNEPACLGQTVKVANQEGNTPHEGVEQTGRDNAGELLQAVKGGEEFYTTDEGEVLGCF